MGWKKTGLGLTVGVLLAVTLAIGAVRLTGSGIQHGSGPSPKPMKTGKTVLRPPRPSQRIFAYYYLVWSLRHWRDKLGGQYPYQQHPLPLPATLHEDGCHARSNYRSNELLDVPEELFTQDDPDMIQGDVRLAASAGLSGFIVNWSGTGRSDQTIGSLSYNLRLAGLVHAVREVNAEGIPFKLWIHYKASAEVIPTQAILGDWTYLAREYADDPAFDRSYGKRPVIVWGGSQKYPLSVIRKVSTRFRSTFFLVGDENLKTWRDGRAAYLDGNQYYWSSQNPYTNPRSFAQLHRLADMVRSSGRNPDGTRKVWIAPLIPGYNSELIGGSTCVPRNGGRTMQKIFDGNARSKPDAWALISWNEIAEATHVLPLRRWGRTYLRAVSRLSRTP